MRSSKLFDKLTRFFELFKDKRSISDLHKNFLTIVENTDSREDISKEIVTLEPIYETCIKFIEDEAVNSGFKPEFLGLQRDLYVELEYLLSFGEQDNRHHFLIVIPVAERPLMLKNCLDSLHEQCRIFQYGNFSNRSNGLPFYNKVSVFIFDDSQDGSNINSIKEIASGSNASGIRTHYVGLEEQAGLLEQIPEDIKINLLNLLGTSTSSVAPHKGASVTRNLAYLYLQAFLGKSEEKALIYFMDSDEELGVKINSSGKILDIQFINYFFWLNRILSNSDIEVLTGKVVGDPPVSSAVMISTFLDDILFFFDSVSGLKSNVECIFHEHQTTERSSAEYHDMVKLFGYNSPLSPKKYSCSLTGAHTTEDCFKDFSGKALAFFSGVHPTRTQFYVHNKDFTETENARTVYTGNYVMNSKGLDHFIPFASLKLRMAGPTLGRILKSRLKSRFASANLPLLHKRTISDKHTDEFRSGIFRNEGTVDLSEEFIKQFWGDVMLFSIDELTKEGYPDKEIGLEQITGAVNKTSENLHKLYITQQSETYEKIMKLKHYLADTAFWWNTSSSMDESLENFQLFCSTVEKNFGPDSSVMKNLAAQIKARNYSEKIIQAIHSFYEDEIYWEKALASLCQKTINPVATE